MQKRKGFTTVELVIVIAVIAILAVALIPTFAGLIDSANLSADQQTANSLTSAIMMYTLDHEIKSESDLRDAINAGMGKEFYETLAAKSSKEYNFWYDVTESRVVVKTDDELLEYAEEGLTKDGATGDTTPTWTTTTDSKISSGIRSFSITKDSKSREYILLGNGENELATLVTDLSNAAGETYETTLNTLADAASNSSLGVLKEIANSTPILNSNGLFIPQDAITDAANGNKIENIYIPVNTEVLSSSSVYPTNVTPSELVADDFKLYVPTGTVLVHDVLGLDKTSQEIHMNVDKDNFDKNFFVDSTGATVVLPGNDRYTENDAGDLTNDAGDSLNVKDYGTLESFGVTFIAENAPDGKKMLNLEGSTLYVSANHKGNITLNANTFLGTLNGVEGSTIPIAKINCEAGTVKGTTCVISNFSNEQKITVSAREGDAKVSYTYTVKIIEVEGFGIKTVGNKTPESYGDYNLTYDKNDTSNQTWDVTFDPRITDKYTGVHLDTSVKLTTGHDLFDFDGTTLTPKSDLDLSAGGEKILKLGFTCASYTEEIFINVNLCDTSLSAFAPSDNTKKMTALGQTFVVGTGSPAMLSNLFSGSAENFSLWVDIAGDTLIHGKDISEFNIVDHITKTLEENKIALNAPKEIKLTLRSFGGQPSEELKILLIPDAYNVASNADWVAAPNETSLVILNSEVKLTESIKTTDDKGKEVVSGKGCTSKNITSNQVYGNMQTITATDDFKIIYGSYNYLINTDGGIIDRLIIMGPDYGKEVSITGSNGDADSKGTFVAAVKAKNGAMITNCFLSGFRSPLHAEGGKVTVKNTTLLRGNYANIYVDQETELVLNTVTTVQYNGKDNNIGAGISYKFSAGTNTISATNLTQHNFVTATDIQNIVNTAKSSAGDVLSGILNILPSFMDPFALNKTDWANISDVKHTITTETGNKEYYHMGVTIISIPLKGASPTLESFDGTGYIQTTRVTKSALSTDLVHLDVFGKETCSGKCTCEIPPADPTYHYNEFINLQKNLAK